MAMPFLPTADDPAAGGEVWFLGIDTSAYTTSVALMDGRGTLVADERVVLAVPEGRRGLRQSDAVFQHVRNLPGLFERLPEGWGRRVEAVAASGSPRPVPGSYMPVFLAGMGAAKTVAGALGVPFQRVSHQEGHVWAGFWSADEAPPPRFLALHVSGGTTEMLLGGLTSDGPAQARFSLQRIGGTQDLAAGQMVDRVGVALGLPFPAGPSLEKLAAGADGPGAGGPGAGNGPAGLKLPISVQGSTISFSGPATAALRALEKGAPPPELARAVEVCVADTLAGMVRGAVQGEGGSGLSRVRYLLAVGGVMANRFIRGRFQRACEGLGITCFFAEPRYSVDNAVGVAASLAYAHALGKLRT